LVSKLNFVCRFQTKEKEETATLFINKGEAEGEIFMTTDGIRSRVLKALR
jgi:hypothetical protein